MAGTRKETVPVGANTVSSIRWSRVGEFRRAPSRDTSGTCQVLLWSRSCRVNCEMGDARAEFECRGDSVGEPGVVPAPSKASSGFAVNAQPLRIYSPWQPGVRAGRLCGPPAGFTADPCIPAGHCGQDGEVRDTHLTGWPSRLVGSWNRVRLPVGVSPPLTGAPSTFGRPIPGVARMVSCQMQRHCLYLRELFASPHSKNVMTLWMV